VHEFLKEEIIMTTREYVIIRTAIIDVKNATRHHNGNFSYHRIGSELCHIARKGTTDRSELKGYICSPELIRTLQVYIPAITGEDYGKHTDHTYRKIAAKMMAAVGLKY
jgi:hypothetical protein